MGALEQTTRVILRSGQLISVTHGATVVTCLAFVRGYTASELAGGIELGDKQVIVAGNVVFPWGDPVKNDRVTIDRKTANIMTVENVYEGATLVRRNITVRGA